MENLAERIKVLNKGKLNPEVKDYQNMSLEQLGKIVHRKGTTHTGKTYNQLWETEGDYCQWVANRVKDEGDWKPFLHFLRLKADAVEKEMGKEEKKKNKEKPKAVSSQSDSPSMSSEESGWNPVPAEDQGASNQNIENMMNQMVQVMNNLSERLANLEAAQQQNQGMIVQGCPNQPQ